MRSVSTPTVAMQPWDEARRRVRETAGIDADKGRIQHLFGKRIDSTFRGNIGAEIEALLEVLGEEATAVVVPSFPDSGRSDSGRISHGPRGSAATDRRGPGPDRSHPTFLYPPASLEQQTRYPIAFIELETILNSGSRHRLGTVPGDRSGAPHGGDGRCDGGADRPNRQRDGEDRETCAFRGSGPADGGLHPGHGPGPSSREQSAGDRGKCDSTLGNTVGTVDPGVGL